MVLMIVFSLVAVVCLAGALSSAWERWERGIVIYFLLTLLFGFASLHSAVNEVGYGRVPEEAEPFAKRLKPGVQYQFLASIRQGGTEVVFVEPYSGGITTHGLQVIRVKGGETPPEHFVLVAGKPVAVVVDKLAK